MSQSWWRLPGVGPALAGRLIADREDRGPYRVPEDLERVPGLGAVTVGRIKPYLTGWRIDGNRPSSGMKSRLDVNRATAEELERLPGIGPERAGAIVEDREEGGDYMQLEDLLRVRGIGPATLERLRTLVDLP